MNGAARILDPPASVLEIESRCFFCLCEWLNCGGIAFSLHHSVDEITFAVENLEDCPSNVLIASVDQFNAIPDEDKQIFWESKAKQMTTSDLCKTPCNEPLKRM